jgi:hypothetical protein
MDQFARAAVAEVSQNLDIERVAKLLEALRQRTPREITIATIGLGGCFTPEMLRALELLAAERSAARERDAAKTASDGAAQERSADAPQRPAAGKARRLFARQ